MRLRLIVALLVVGFALPAIAQEKTEENTQDIRQSYLNAKKLYGEKNYKDAIKAFNEIRKTRYHPILDYRIGLCYEALKDYKNAKTYYKVYIEYYDNGYPVGKNHPKPKDVKKRIENLEAAKAPPVTPAPAVEVEDLKPAASTETDKPTTEATQTHYDPYTEQAPPGYDEYDTPPPPPPPRRGYRRPGHPRVDRWASLYITGDFGGAGLAGDTADDAGYDGGGGGAWAGVFFRPLAFLSAGVLVGGHGYLPKSSDDYDNELGHIFAGVAVRGHLPLMGYTWQPWSMEIFGELSGGFAYSTIENMSGLEESMRGAFLGAGAGIDIYLARWLSVGALFRVVKPFWNKACVDGTCNEFGDGAEAPEDIAIYGGFSATLHLYIM